MKKTLLTAILFLFLNSNLAAQTSFLDIKAERIAAKDHKLKLPVLKLAMEAYYNAQKLGIKPTKPILTLIDYSIPSTKRRLWVLDINLEKILHKSMVAHGKNSGKKYATSFSNIANSRQSCIGLFITKNSYIGKHGYSLRLEGLDKGFNDNAISRAIVIHGAPYVSKTFAKKIGRTGRSWGCPAIEKKLVKPIISTIKDGTLVFSFYPDKRWLKSSRFINTQI